METWGHLSPKRTYVFPKRRSPGLESDVLRSALMLDGVDAARTQGVWEWSPKSAQASNIGFRGPYKRSEEHVPHLSREVF